MGLLVTRKWSLMQSRSGCVSKVSLESARTLITSLCLSSMSIWRRGDVIREEMKTTRLWWLSSKCPHPIRATRIFVSSRVFSWEHGQKASILKDTVYILASTKALEYLSQTLPSHLQCSCKMSDKTFADFCRQTFLVSLYSDNGQFHSSMRNKQYAEVRICKRCGPLVVVGCVGKTGFREADSEEDDTDSTASTDIPNDGKDVSPPLSRSSASFSLLSCIGTAGVRERWADMEDVFVFPTKNTFIHFSKPESTSSAKRSKSLPSLSLEPP